jgi:hypothetical protein
VFGRVCMYLEESSFFCIYIHTCTHNASSATHTYVDRFMFLRPVLFEGETNSNLYARGTVRIYNLKSVYIL